MRGNVNTTREGCDGTFIFCLWVQSRIFSFLGAKGTVVFCGALRMLETRRAEAELLRHRVLGAAAETDSKVLRLCLRGWACLAGHHPFTLACQTTAWNCAPG